MPKEEVKNMLASSPINAFVRITDAQRARHFYEDVLSLRVVSDNPFVMVFRADNALIMAQKAEKFSPLQGTVLGWEVKDINKAIEALVKKGVVFERFQGMDQDELGIWKSPDGKVAWFKDPDGNILSLSQHANY
jgi:catechol 2,3-dioxygenase-like lactoylglutathione lyase family enzyme